MSDLTVKSQHAVQARPSSVIYSPTPIRNLIPTKRPALFTSLSLTEIPQHDTFIRRQRPYRSLIEKISHLNISNADSDT